MLQRLNENKDLIIVAVASFFIGFGAASFFGTGFQKETASTLSLQKENPLSRPPSIPPLPPADSLNAADADKTTNKPSTPVKAMGSDTIRVENQRAGTIVVVQQAELSQPRWVVVHEMRENRDRGNVLGAGWFPAGTHTDIPVELLRGTTGGEEYYVIVYTDEGTDKQFNHTVDKPLVNISGNVIQATFMTIANPGS